MVVSAFEKKLILNTFLVLVLKEFIQFTGVLLILPQVISQLPIPPFLTFAILFFLGGIISGAQGIIALGTPLAKLLSREESRPWCFSWGWPMRPARFRPPMCAWW